MNPACAEAPGNSHANTAQSAAVLLVACGSPCADWPAAWFGPFTPTCGLFALPATARAAGITHGSTGSGGLDGDGAPPKRHVVSAARAAATFSSSLRSQRGPASDQYVSCRAASQASNPGGGTGDVHGRRGRPDASHSCCALLGSPRREEAAKTSSAASSSSPSSPSATGRGLPSCAYNVCSEYSSSRD